MPTNGGPHRKFFATMIKLAILWGHIPRGISRCTHRISRRQERIVPFALSRNGFTGMPAESVISSFGSYHLLTSQGPRPASLVEIMSQSSGPAPTQVVSILHAISIGFPVAGEVVYAQHEKFLNPILPIPVDVPECLLQDWIDQGASAVFEDGLSRRLMDYRDAPVNQSDSVVRWETIDIEHHFAGESSKCNYVDHPESTHVRRDRGA